MSLGRPNFAADCGWGKFEAGSGKHGIGPGRARAPQPRVPAGAPDNERITLQSVERRAYRGVGAPLPAGARPERRAVRPLDSSAIPDPAAACPRGRGRICCAPVVGAGRPGRAGGAERVSDGHDVRACQARRARRRRCVARPPASNRPPLDDRPIRPWPCPLRAASVWPAAPAGAWRRRPRGVPERPGSPRRRQRLDAASGIERAALPVSGGARHRDRAGGRHAAPPRPRRLQPS
jgi:hypothetical protein